MQLAKIFLPICILICFGKTSQATVLDTVETIDTSPSEEKQSSAVEIKDGKDLAERLYQEIKDIADSTESEWGSQKGKFSKPHPLDTKYEDFKAAINVKELEFLKESYSNYYNPKSYQRIAEKINGFNETFKKNKKGEFGIDVYDKFAVYKDIYLAVIAAGKRITDYKSGDERKAVAESLKQYVSALVTIVPWMDNIGNFKNLLINVEEFKEGKSLKASAEAFWGRFTKADLNGLNLGDYLPQYLHKKPSQTTSEEKPTQQAEHVEETEAKEEKIEHLETQPQQPQLLPHKEEEKEGELKEATLKPEDQANQSQPESPTILAQDKIEEKHELQQQPAPTEQVIQIQPRISEEIKTSKTEKDKVDVTQPPASQTVEIKEEPKNASPATSSSSPISSLSSFDSSSSSSYSVSSSPSSLSPSSTSVSPTSTSKQPGPQGTAPPITTPSAPSTTTTSSKPPAKYSTMKIVGIVVGFFVVAAVLFVIVYKFVLKKPPLGASAV